MTATLRRLASAIFFTSPRSQDGSFQRNVHSNSASFSGRDEGETGIETSRCLLLSTVFIDMRIEGFIAHTQLTQKFQLTEDSWSAESYYYFHLPKQATVTSFKLEIGDDHAIDDDSRPTKQARKLYQKAVNSNTPAAILREVEPGFYQANLGCVPPGVQVIFTVKYAECLESNARGGLCVRIPGTSARSSFSEDTRVSLNIAITQDASIHNIFSSTHQKLLSIKAEVLGYVREVESFDALQQKDLMPNLEQLNQASVSVSGNRATFDRGFELTITTSNKANKTAASLSPINRFGHAVLLVTIRPCELFTGEQDTEWSIQIGLDHPWTCCRSDLRDLNLTRIPHNEANMSPSTFKLVQSPKILPKISHLQHQSVYFLLDFKGSTEYALKSVQINGIRTGQSNMSEAKTLDVIRKDTVEMTLQQLCVGAILRNLYGTLLSRELECHHYNWDGQSNLFSNAERLGQMYAVCSHWTSKLAASSIDDTDNGNVNGSALYEDELSRFVLPRHSLSLGGSATSWLPETPQVQWDSQPAFRNDSTEQFARPVGPPSHSVSTGSELSSPMMRRRAVKPRSAYGGQAPTIHAQAPAVYDVPQPHDMMMARPLHSHTPWRMQPPPPPPPPLPPLLPAEDARKTAILSPRQNEYFIPRNGIDREVIAADIRPYLGNDAKVRPGTYKDKRTGRVVQGYFVTAYRNLTSAMINDLKADSVKWPQEMIHSGSSRRNAETRSPVTFPTNIYHDSAISNRRDQKEAARYPTAGTSEIHPNAAAQNPYYSGSHILPYLPQSQQLSQYTWYDWPYSDQPHGQPYSVLENRPEPRDTESHELHPIWLQIKALGSVNRTYTLPVDLRNEVERHFEPGTRDWLTRRIIPSLPDDNGETTLEAVLDTVLLLVFVWLYISERYVEVAQHVGLILKSGHDQRVIFVELVARVVAR